MIAVHAIQAQFTDVTGTYGLYVESLYADAQCGVSMHDFDRDGLVDLTYASNGMGVYTYRNMGNYFEQLPLLGGIDGFIAHPIWVDFDNDGDADFFATRVYDCPVLMRNDGDLTFTDVSDSLACVDVNVNSTCASWGDYNNDGLLDLYMANYYVNPPGPTSWFYRNNGNGSFTEMASELHIENGVLPAYQVMWIDFDFDFDQDLFICNDKSEGNKLYRNNGDGTFEDFSEESGFGVSLDAMSLSVSDFDHDADYDFYISNTFNGNFFMVNNAGVMTNQSAALNTEVNAFCWGSVFIDTKGKTWEDVYVVNSSELGGNVLLNNVSGQVFESDYTAFAGDDSEFIYTVAKGDINGDGSYDLAVNPFYANQSLLFESSAEFDAWVSVALQGTVSNRDGIGAHVSCYVAGVNLLRAKTCGENFMSQDAQYLVFATNGLPVDSIVVQWPSGIRDVMYNPALDQTHLIIESQPEPIAQVIELTICPGDTMFLQPPGAIEVAWSTGSEELVMAVTAPGNYTAAYTDEQQQQAVIAYQLAAAPEFDYQVQVMEPSCHGYADGSLQWFSDVPVSVWVNEVVAEGNEISGLMAGLYSVHMEDSYGCVSEVDAILENPAALTAIHSTNPGCYGDFSYYSIEVAQAQGYVMIDGIDQPEGFLPQGVYPYSVTDEMGCAFHDTLVIETLALFAVQRFADTLCASQPTASVQLEFIGGVEPFINIGPDLPFDAMPPGDYQTQWMDAAGCSAQNVISIQQFEPIEISVEENTDQLMVEVEGGMPPYVITWSNGDSGPVLQASPGTYTCVVSDFAGCTESMDAELLVGMEETHAFGISAYPIPFREELNWSGARPLHWSVYNAQGQCIVDPAAGSWPRWDTQAWAAGVYVVCMVDFRGNSHRLTIVKEQP